MTKINKSKRVTVHIPEGTAVHEFLSKNNNIAKWELLNSLVEQLPKSKEEKAVLLFDEFVKNVCDLYPNIKTNLNVLRPYVFRRLIKGEALDSQYFEELKQI
jgi:hypothetical protein